MSSDAKTAASYEEGLQGASDKVAEFQEQKTALKRLQHWLHMTPSAVPMIVLVAAIVVFGLLSPNFFKAVTLSTILQQIAIVGILGCAQSLVVLTAGIDLSVGAIAVFSSVLMGQFTFRYGIPAPLAIALGLAAGTAMGFANGWLVARIKLPPFIVTLGTWQIILAANYIYSANETIRSSAIAAEAPALQFWGYSIQPGGVKILYAVFLMVALVALAEKSGQHIDLDQHPLGAHAGQFRRGNIQSITAVVIGGISLFGGRGSIVGMFFGALIVGVFEMGLKMVGTDPQWTFFLIGLLIILAVAVDQWIRKASA